MNRMADLFADSLDPDRPTHAFDSEAAAILDRTRAALMSLEMWDGPSAEARGKLLAVATAERPPAQVRQMRRPLRLPFRTLTAVASGAAAAAVLLLFFLPLARGTGGADFDLAGGPFSPEATAVATVEPQGDGMAITLAVDGLPSADVGTYYAAWVAGDNGMVPVGSFHNRSGTSKIELWSGVDATRFPTLMVTVQTEGAPPFPIGPVAIHGAMAPGP